MGRLASILVCATTGALMTAAATAAEPDLPSKVVYQAGADGYHTYRIPVVIATPDGTLLAFCEGRKTSRSDAGDIDLLLKRSSDNGETWSNQTVVHEEGGEAPITIGNPCPVVDRSTGTIWLAFSRNNERAFITSSKDDGEAWAAPKEISEPLKAFPFAWKRLGMGPVNGIQTANGSLVLPVWLNDRKGGEYRSAAVYSDDHGKTWKAGGIVPPALPGCNECTVAEVDPGRLCMNVRNKHKNRRRGVSWSEDGGLTWSPPELAAALVGPVCQASLLRAGESAALLFSNPASTSRERMTVRVSHDGGDSWSEGRLLWHGPAAYSCLTPLPGGGYGCLFEAGETSPYESIRFARFTLEHLNDGD